MHENLAKSSVGFPAAPHHFAKVFGRQPAGPTKVATQTVLAIGRARPNDFAFVHENFLGHVFPSSFHDPGHTMFVDREEDLR